MFRVFASFAKPNQFSAAVRLYYSLLFSVEPGSTFVAFEPDDIGRALQAMEALRISGATISQPYKQSVIGQLDTIDSAARQVGAVNTVVNQAGKLKGFNTDWTGAAEALVEQVPLESKRVAVLGAGGAARAVVYGLLHHGARPTVFNRDPARAERLVSEIGGESGGAVRDLSSLRDFEILVQATPVGQTPHVEQLPIEASALAKNLTVLDLVFDPRETALLRAARRAGCNTISGWRMLEHQAAAQIEIFTGHKPALEPPEHRT